MSDYNIEITQAPPVVVEVAQVVTNVVHGSELGAVQVFVPASTTHVVGTMPEEPLVAVQFIAGPPGP